MSTFESPNIKNLQNKSYQIANQSQKDSSLQISSLLPAALVALILGLWVYACFTSGMYLVESVICSGMIMAIGIIKLVNSNSIIKSNKK